MRQVACVILLLCSFASAETKLHTAGTLRDECRSVEVRGANIVQAMDAGLCLGYMKGYLDGVFWASQVPFDRDITAGQMAHVLVKYVGDHPEYENKPAGGVLTLALIDSGLITMK